MKVGLETPQKHKLGGKVSEKLHLKLGMDLKKGQQQGRDEKTQKPALYTILRNDGGLLSGLQRNALASL